MQVWREALGTARDLVAHEPVVEGTSDFAQTSDDWIEVLPVLRMHTFEPGRDTNEGPGEMRLFGDADDDMMMQSAWRGGGSDEGSGSAFFAGAEPSSGSGSPSNSAAGGDGRTVAQT